MEPKETREGCGLCRYAAPLEFDFSYAFQPIVDIDHRQVFAHEALVRGAAGEPESTVLSRVTNANRYQFDQACRGKAIEIEYKRIGFMTAIDDFGAGFAGLNLLADFQPDIVKLDMALTRGIDSDRVRRAIVSGIVRLCDELGIRVIAEGIETPAECLTLRDEGVTLFQGYLFARPGFEDLPKIDEAVWPAVAPRRAADRRRR